MANEITVTVLDVRPLNGAVIRRAIATEALAFGDAVYIDSGSGRFPKVSKILGGAVATCNPFGVVVAPQPDTMGGASVAAGETCDVCVYGPVTGYSSMTPGATLWASDTAGRLSSVVGTKSGVIGFAESATVAFIRPGLFAVSS